MRLIIETGEITLVRTKEFVNKMKILMYRNGTEKVMDIKQAHVLCLLDILFHSVTPNGLVSPPETLDVETEDMDVISRWVQKRMESEHRVMEAL